VASELVGLVVRVEHGGEVWQRRQRTLVDAPLHRRELLDRGYRSAWPVAHRSSLVAWVLQDHRLQPTMDAAHQHHVREHGARPL
jgi:hypothetical protein